MQEKPRSYAENYVAFVFSANHEEIFRIALFYGG
jgi:hypothetical protein